MREQDRALWPAWLEAAGAGAIAPSGPSLLVDPTTTAAEAGQGFALADRIVAADARCSPDASLRRGRALRLLSCAPPGRAHVKAACDFRAWIKGEIARTLATLRHKLDGIANS